MELVLKHTGILSQDRDIKFYYYTYDGANDPTILEIELAIEKQLDGEWIFKSFYSKPGNSEKMLMLHKVPDLKDIL